MFNPEIDLTLEEEAAMTLDKKTVLGIQLKNVLVTSDIWHNVLVTIGSEGEGDIPFDTDTEPYAISEKEVPDSAHAECMSFRIFFAKHKRRLS